MSEEKEEHREVKVKVLHSGEFNVTDEDGRVHRVKASEGEVILVDNGLYDVLSKPQASPKRPAYFEKASLSRVTKSRSRA